MYKILLAIGLLYGGEYLIYIPLNYSIHWLLRTDSLATVCLQYPSTAD